MTGFRFDLHLSKDWFNDNSASRIVDTSRFRSKGTGHTLSSGCILWDPPSWRVTHAFVVLNVSSCDESVDV